MIVDIGNNVFFKKLAETIQTGNYSKVNGGDLYFSFFLEKYKFTIYEINTKEFKAAAVSVYRKKMFGNYTKLKFDPPEYLSDLICMVTNEYLDPANS